MCQTVSSSYPHRRLCLRQYYNSVPLQLWSAISEVKSNMSPCILFTLSPAEQTALRLVPHFPSGRPNSPHHHCWFRFRAHARVSPTCARQVRYSVLLLRGHLTFPRLRRQLVGLLAATHAVTPFSLRGRPPPSPLDVMEWSNQKLFPAGSSFSWNPKARSWRGDWRSIAR